MIKFLIIILVFFVSGNVYSQDNNILYYVTSSVNDSLNKNIDINKTIGCVWQDEGENIVLLFFEVDSLSNLSLIVKKTNRFLCIDRGRKIPIIFNSDFKFSTIFNTLDSDNTVSTDSNIILGGYVVRINGRFMSGKVIESFYDR